MLEPKVVLEMSVKVIEQLQATGLDDADVARLARQALARELCRAHYLSIGLASELAGLGRAQFMAELITHKLPLIDLSEDDLKGEFDLLDGMLGKGAGR